MEGIKADLLSGCLVPATHPKTNPPNPASRRTTQVCQLKELVQPKLRRSLRTEHILLPALSAVCHHPHCHVEWIVCGPSACEGIFMNYKPGFSTKNQTAKYVKMLFWKHFRRRRMTATGSDIDNEAVVSGCQALAATKRWLTGRHIQQEEDWRDEMPSHRWNQNGCRPPELKSWGVRLRPSLGRSTERIQDMWAGGLRPELYRFSELFSAPQRVQCEIARPRFSGSVCKCSCDSGGPTGHSHL